MSKVEVTVNEKWPVFELIPPKVGQEDYQFDIPQEMYQDYLYVMQRYLEFQLKLQAFYEAGNSRVTKRICGHNVPKGSCVDTEYEFNTTRNMSAETSV